MRPAAPRRQARHLHRRRRHHGLGRTTLYRNPALRALIDDHRRRAASSGTLAGITEEIALLRTALDRAR